MTKAEELGPYVAFGAWIREKRRAAKLLSQPQAEIRARARGLKLINQGKLSHIERGMNSNPDPKFLAQLAELYGLAYGDVVTRWMRVRYDVATDIESGLSSQGGTGQQDPRQQGGADVSAEARVRELQGRLEEYERLIAELQGVASRLVSIAARGAEGRDAVRPSASSRGHRRKTG